MVPRVRLSLTAAIRRCSNTDSNLCSLIANVAEIRSSLLLHRQGNKGEPSEDELTPTHSTQISRCLWSAVAQRWTVGLSTERAGFESNLLLFRSMGILLLSTTPLYK